ncbi:hypothetical protein SAMN05443575_4025 [Jatrophihabitans endophyticus]|uniref:Uncharacterized protein n=1 Tax=Jatrophihabitans endophyticus TaxID=1206085 RepID=A0A1M5TSA3_9ACTN|nr:hypothetical protein [Jatrophihabitans endophyticus]SHH53695.1 hypothetical protein SAMN05443575_4025 [Jatrophihabitans endophyticus]
MAGLLTRFTDFAASPPVWSRLLILPIGVLVVVELGSKRGWPMGVVAAIVYGIIALAMWFDANGAFGEWSRRHPVAEGLFLGPLAFLLLAYVTSWSLWTCLLGGAAAALIGAGFGVRRARSDGKPIDA